MGLVGLLLLAALAPASLAVGDVRPGVLVHQLGGGSVAESAADDQPGEPALEPDLAEGGPVPPSAEHVASAFDSAALAAGLQALAPRVAAEQPASDPSQSANAELAPTQVVIPALELAAPVVAVGLTPWGAMATPERVDEVGWFAPGAAPGPDGTAILAGHRDSPAGPAIFFHLERLKTGDEIQVFRRAGAAPLTFRVQRVEIYPYDAAPLETIFGANATPGLILITCVGDFSYAEGYADRVVVYAAIETT